jgi:hypothetical protein
MKNLPLNRVQFGVQRWMMNFDKKDKKSGMGNGWDYPSQSFNRFRD